MKEKISKSKKPVLISFNHIIIQFLIIMFYVITWLSSPLFGMGNLNLGYFLFMFISMILAAIITLYSKAKPEMPIPKKPTQQFANLIKVVVDTVATKIFNTNKHPEIEKYKDEIKRALIWSLREAEISPEYDSNILIETKKYLYDKLFPKEENTGE